jgi:hypothetical protein
MTAGTILLVVLIVRASGVATGLSRTALEKPASCSREPSTHFGVTQSASRRGAHFPLRSLNPGVPTALAVKSLWLCPAQDTGFDAMYADPPLLQVVANHLDGALLSRVAIQPRRANRRQSHSHAIVDDTAVAHRAKRQTVRPNTSTSCSLSTLIRASSGLAPCFRSSAMRSSCRWMPKHFGWATVCAARRLTNRAA